VVTPFKFRGVQYTYKTIEWLGYRAVKKLRQYVKPFP